MKEPDWEKAPEGATHALTTGPKWDGSPSVSGEIRYAVKQGKSYVEVGDPLYAAFCMGERSWVVISKRPVAWTGEGLPPVGTVCEYRCGYVEQPYEYSECRIIAHFEGESGHALAAFTYVAHDGVIQLGRGAPSLFRPIRTPEQIAAEERLHSVRNACTAIADTLDSLRGKTKVERAALAVVEAMIDAGYTRVEQ